MTSLREWCSAVPISEKLFDLQNFPNCCGNALLPTGATRNVPTASSRACPIGFVAVQSKEPKCEKFERCKSQPAPTTDNSFHVPEKMVDWKAHGLHMENTPCSDNDGPAFGRTSSLPSWKREVEPLPGWTLEEQRALEVASKELQKERSSMAIRGIPVEYAHWQYVRLISRRVPSKSLEECADCLKHVLKGRVAYFGPRTSRCDGAPTPRDPR